MTFDYKKYSLENLEKWIEDAINSSEASPQEIYDVIKNVVKDNYYCYKNNTERCYELLALLNGNGKGHIQVEEPYPLYVSEDGALFIEDIVKKKDKVVRWILPVEETKITETDEIEYFVSFPDDLLEAANLKEGDRVEWVDRGDGSYLIKKVND